MFCIECVNDIVLQWIIHSYVDAVVAAFSRLNTRDKTKQNVHDGWHTKVVQ